MTFENRKKTGSPSPISTILLILFIGIIGIAIYKFYPILFPKQQQPIPEYEQPIEDKITQIPVKPDQPAVPPPQKKEIEIPAPEPVIEKTQEEILRANCLTTAAELQDYFDDLSQKDHFREAHGNEDAYTYYQSILSKLFSKPPIVLHETESLFSILKNTAHFYRVLGPKNMLLLKEILDQQHYRLEDDLALFHKWVKLDSCADQQIKRFDLPLPQLYEYAVFFTTTLGGQSYLFRRESDVRQLVQYYCILIIDMANDAVINKYGTDIRQPIDFLQRDLQGNQNLENKALYLETLSNLSEKYRLLYGQ